MGLFRALKVLFTGKFDFEREEPPDEDAIARRQFKREQSALSKISKLEAALDEARKKASDNARIANGILQCVHYQPNDRTYVIFEDELALHPELDEMRKLLPH